MSDENQKPIIRLDERYLPIYLFNHEKDKVFEKLPIFIYTTKLGCKSLEAKNKSVLLSELNIAIENQTGNDSERSVSDTEFELDENDSNNVRENVDAGETEDTEDESAAFLKCMKNIIDKYLNQNDKTASKNVENAQN